MRRLPKKLWRVTYDENQKAILDLLDYNPSAKALDCGCHNGEFTREIGQKIGTKHLYGIELAEARVQEAEDKGIKVYPANLNERLPLDDETFDIITANQLIEHLYHTDTFVKEIWRALKWGGVAVISAPNLASLHSIFSLILGYQPLTAFVSDEVRAGTLFVLQPELPPAGCIYPAQSHLRIFTGRALKELLEYHGFQVERLVGTGYYPFTGKIARLASWIDARHSVNVTIKARKVRIST